MNKRAIRWLYGEIPSLVESGVLGPDAAERLRTHYGEMPRAGRRLAVTLFSIFGALCIGGGVILLLAHNWAGLSRGARTVLALLPLVVTQAVGLWALYTGRRSAAWREGVGALQALAIGSSIALIGQTYHIPGDLGAFLLTWCLLGLPVIYLLGATTPAILYLAGITSWSGYNQSVGGQALAFWALFAAVLPYFWSVARKNRYSARAATLGWALVLCLCVATGITLEKVIPGLWMIVYSALFAVLYLAGKRWFGDAPLAAQRPFHMVGAGGIAVLAWLLTFEFPWDELGWDHYRSAYRYHMVAAWMDYLLAAALPVASVALLVPAVKRRGAWPLLYGVMPILVIVAYALTGASLDGLPAQVLMNVYLFVLGVGTLVAGIRGMRISVVNGGMVILATLIITRFFDSDLGFVVRGVVFIAIGIGFLVANLLLMRNRAPKPVPPDSGTRGRPDTEIRPTGDSQGGG